LNWLPQATLTNQNGSAVFLDPSSGGLPRQFYRVVEP